MLLRLLLLLLLPQKNNSANDSCDLKVEFSSKNFKNILTWTTTNKKEGIRYNVMYKKYGKDPWWKKAECTNITQNWCDLTKETSHLTSKYYGMVVISDQNCSVQTDRFKPLFDTILDPPEVNLFFNDTTIEIHLAHVLENLSSIHKDLTYEINISGFDTVTPRVPYFKIENLDLRTSYCVSARLSCFRCRTLLSNQKCTTPKTDHSSEERTKIMLYILASVLVIFAVFSAGYGVHKYIYVDNPKQPKILNIKSNNKNNVVLFDAHNVTINIIKIESGKSLEQNTMMADKEDKTQVKTDLYFTDGGYDASHGSQVAEGDDHGYVSLLEQVPATKPQVSPYDMPHNLVKIPVKPLMVPSVTNTEEDLYGRIKCNSNIASIEVKSTVEEYQKSDISEETFTYLPKNDQHIPKLHDLHCELSKTRESSIGQDVKDDADFSECDTLFVDWSPTSHHLYIPNFPNKTVDEVGTEECQQVEGLLSHLYKPIQIEETSEELACLEERWQLHVKTE
ncbi:interleukin-20 receptor subunit alpha-like [Bufo gargarizans]|uniref:interleukin-20 receptor subunit alpha-like n=1 Tax=Bufo gargarizans TaxID=30331 RepID=UPI001CF19588|nr:interleukin-20 receptor subunit alpha-like [Bufo gargarizans]